MDRVKKLETETGLAFPLAVVPSHLANLTFWKSPRQPLKKELNKLHLHQVQISELVGPPVGNCYIWSGKNYLVYFKSN